MALLSMTKEKPHLNVMSTIMLLKVLSNFMQIYALVYYVCQHNLLCMHAPSYLSEIMIFK